nr:MAG TPA: hypothetical protein [Caudoviricetes sp.]
MAKSFGKYHILLVNFLVNFFKKSWSGYARICSKIAVFAYPATSKSIHNLFSSLAPLTY